MLINSRSAASTMLALIAATACGQVVVNVDATRHGFAFRADPAPGAHEFVKKIVRGKPG